MCTGDLRAVGGSHGRPFDEEEAQLYAFVAAGLQHSKDWKQWPPLPRKSKQGARKEARRVGKPPLSFREYVKKYPSGNCFVCCGMEKPHEHNHRTRPVYQKDLEEHRRKRPPCGEGRTPAGYGGKGSYVQEIAAEFTKVRRCGMRLWQNLGRHKQGCCTAHCSVHLGFGGRAEAHSVQTGCGSGGVGGVAGAPPAVHKLYMHLSVFFVGAWDGTQPEPSSESQFQVMEVGITFSDAKNFVANCFCCFAKAQEQQYADGMWERGYRWGCGCTTSCAQAVHAPQCLFCG